MTRLKWNAIGERTFEAGIDRGVLYVDGSDGAPWNGLVAVSESPSGGEVTPYYADGVKYLNHVSNEEFEAVVEAYTYPEEFAVCDGTVSVSNGLFATHQRKKSFGLAYRTKLGNDVKGADHGYKIHLVYDATAFPTERQYSSLGDTVDPTNFSWRIVTKAPEISGVVPTAHFVIDSNDVPSDLLTQVEDILYGSETAAPRLPSVSELFFLFNEYESTWFDAGTLVEEYFNEFDAGVVGEEQTSNIDAGGP